MKINKSKDKIETLEIKIRHLTNQHEVVKQQFEKTTENYYKILDDVSKANKQLLSAISVVSGGKLFELHEARKIKDELLSIVTKIEDENLDRSLKLEKNEGYRFFLLLIICFLMMALITRGLRWRNMF